MIPSILSIVGLLMLPVFVLAVVGLIKPAVVLSRGWMKKVCIAGAVLSALEVVFVPLAVVASFRSPVTLVVPSPLPSQVRVMYGIQDGDARSLGWRRKYTANAAGLSYTQYSRDRGNYRYGKPFPIAVVSPRATGGVDTVGGTWIRGGYTTAGDCWLEFDEFVIGDTSAARVAEFDAASRWLDSIAAWRVRCTKARSYRARRGHSELTQRTGDECYYLRSGSMQCLIRRAAK